MYLDVQVRVGSIHKFWDYHLLSPVNFCFLLGLLIQRYKVSLQALGVFSAIILSVILMIGALSFMRSGSAELIVIGRYVGVALSCGMFVTGFLNYRCGENAGRADKRLSGLLILIGNASYSLYLVHWVILINFGRLKYRGIISIPDEFAELWRYSFVGISICIAIGMFFLLEKPLAIAANKLSKKLNANV